MTRVIIPVLASILMFAVGDASAWNAVGHMTVTKIALDELDAKHQLALYNLLKQHPHFKDHLSASRPADIDNEVQWVLLRASVWPDWVRGAKKDGAGASIQRY